MGTPDDVLRILEEYRGKYVSGERIADELEISRNAVWKAIGLLRGRNFIVESTPRRGYRLSADCGELSLPGIGKYLKAEWFQINLFEELPSTNTLLGKMAAEGAPEGTVVIAKAQTAGRGRMGRSFFSPPNTGIYMSVLLRPALSPDKGALITTCAAVAACEAIEAVSEVRAEIKWVNDILISGRKVGGILTEATLNMETGRIEHAVLGVGINIAAPEGGFPEELRDTAGSVQEVFSENAKNRIAAEILNRLAFYYPNIENGEFVPEYRRRSAVIGREIKVFSGETAVEAVALGIDDDCRLLVRYRDGSEEALSSGEISVRLPKEV